MLRRTFLDISISKYLIKSKRINHYLSRLQWFMVVIQMIIFMPIADKWLKPTHACITYWLRYKKKLLTSEIARQWNNSREISTTYTLPTCSVCPAISKCEFSRRGEYTTSVLKLCAHYDLIHKLTLKPIGLFHPPKKRPIDLFTSIEK